MIEIADKERVGMTGLRWLRPRYGLRTLLVLVTAAAAFLGWEEYITWKEQQAAREIELLYGSVEFESLAPEWLRRLAGEDYLKRATRARIHSATTDDSIPHLRAFGRLDAVVIVSDLAGNAGLSEERFEAALPHATHTLDQQWPVSSWNAIETAHLPPLVRAGITEHLEGVSVAGSTQFRVVVVRLPYGEYRCVVLGDYRPISYSVNDWSIVLLFDGNRLIDWKEWTWEPDDGNVEAAIEDVNRDGVIDVGFQTWRVPDLSTFDANTVPDIDPVWLEVYQITPEGFVPIGQGDGKGNGDRAGS